MNIISKENIKHNSHQNLRSLIQSSSEMNGCPITNILDKEIKSIWLSDESLPQEIILNINKSDFIYFPKKLSAIGIYCWHAYSTNPKLIEVLISTDDNNDNNNNKINNNNINFMSLGDFDLALKPGMQLLHLDEDLLDNKLNDKDIDKIWIKLIIKETFGGKRTYINNLSLYEEIDVNALNLKSIQEENEEEENSSMVYLRESRIKNNFKKNKKNIFGNNFNNINNNNINKNSNNNINNNGNILLTSEILISDSELSDRKIFNDKGDKFKGINMNINMNNNSKSKIPEMSESKENNSSMKNNTIKFTKINNTNNTNNLNLNNHKSNNNKDKDKSPLKSNAFNAFIISDKNLLYSDKKSFLNSNIFNGNNNNLNINTQTSQNNLNNQLLTTEMMKSQMDYLQNEFLCSKGEISNIEYVNDNNNILLINEFHAYQKSQEEKMKKFDERITNIENKINDINISIKTINDNLTKLISDNKLNEAENKINKESIIKECEKLIKINLIDILDKKINPAIFNDNKKINNNNSNNNSNNNNNSDNNSNNINIIQNLSNSSDDNIITIDKSNLNNYC